MEKKYSLWYDIQMVLRRNLFDGVNGLPCVFVQIVCKALAMLEFMANLFIVSFKVSFVDTCLKRHFLVLVHESLRFSWQ